MLAHMVTEWERCRAWLLPALEENTEAEILWALTTGRAQLWRGERSAMVTQLVSGSEPFVMIWLGGGELADLMAMGPGMVAWGRAQGARAARIHGRPGWARALRRLGFERDGDELRKAL